MALASCVRRSAILEILWANLLALRVRFLKGSPLAAWRTLLGMSSFARPTSRLMTLTPSAMRASSVGWWMLVSTTVPSVLSLRPRVTFSERANSHGTVVESRNGLRTDRVRPTDEGGVVGSALEVKPTELPQDDRIGDEVLGLFVAPPIEPLHEEHPQDHLNRRGMAPEPPRVGIALEEIGSSPREEFIVIEQHIESCQLRFHFEFELGDQLEEVHGIVSIDYHEGRASG